jgi:deoxyribose-phosphate aldolase
MENIKKLQLSEQTIPEYKCIKLVYPGERTDEQIKTSTGFDFPIFASEDIKVMDSASEPGKKAVYISDRVLQKARERLQEQLKELTA